MNHCFNLGIANKFGLNVATFLQSIAYWTHNNLTNKRNLINGHCWTYNTLEALLETFTYWSKKQLETVIKNSIEAGLLIKDNHNQTKYDRTCWYALTPAAYRFFPELCQENFFERIYSSISPNWEIEYPEWRNRFPDNGTPIPITIPNTKKDIIRDESVIEEIKAVYHEELPELPEVKNYPNRKILLNSQSENFADTKYDNSLKKDVEKQKTGLQKFIDIWNEIAVPHGCPPTLNNQRERRDIDRHLKRIESQWGKEQITFNEENFQIWLENVIAIDFYMITKFHHPMSTVLREKHFNQSMHELSSRRDLIDSN